MTVNKPKYDRQTPSVSHSTRKFTRRSGDPLRREPVECLPERGYAHHWVINDQHTGECTHCSKQRQFELVSWDDWGVATYTESAPLRITVPKEESL